MSSPPAPITPPAHQMNVSDTWAFYGTVFVLSLGTRMKNDSAAPDFCITCCAVLEATSNENHNFCMKTKRTGATLNSNLYDLAVDIFL